MNEDDFYEDDESPEEIRAAWDRGEKGMTVGPRRLTLPVRVHVVASGTNAITVRQDFT